MLSVLGRENGALDDSPHGGDGEEYLGYRNDRMW